ncbi:MAG TPA: hypothetical protein VN653_10730 [Anaerolineales bacterium]|nr:hypothetical protein [Anaerolineales bacterium]
MQKLETLPPPPGVISSLQAGFNIVSSRIALIILPVLLDVLLWLGPRLSIGRWYGALLSDGLKWLRQGGLPAQDLSAYYSNVPLIVDFLGRLNWLVWIRTLPIGIPALMLNLPGELPVPTPLGLQNVIQLPTFLVVLGSVMLLTFVGWLGGGLYFRVVAGASLGEEEAGISLARAIAQTVLLSVIWGIASVIVVLPLMFLIGLLSALNAVLAEVVFFIILFLMFWFIVPLFFMPHGIFVRKQNAIISIMSSLRMSRFTLPTSSMFVLSVFLLSRGLSYLWLVPPSDSWLMLVGIAGHAFISTTLLAASFVYYRDMNNWLQDVYERFLQFNNKSSMKKV